MAAIVDRIVLRLREREEGQGLVEYVVLIALIALTLFAAILFFSEELGNVFSEITNIINDALPGS
jgi:Flp pilus assembly pilin Flp